MSGTEAGAAIGLRGQDNASVESVCEHVKERRRTRGELQVDLLAICYLLGLVHPGAEFFISVCLDL